MVILNSKKQKSFSVQITTLDGQKTNYVAIQLFSIARNKGVFGLGNEIN